MSLRWNAFGVPMAVLLAASLGMLGWQWMNRREMRLPGSFWKLWMAVLAAAWAAKFVVDAGIRLWRNGSRRTPTSRSRARPARR